MAVAEGTAAEELGAVPVEVTGTAVSKGIEEDGTPELTSVVGSGIEVADSETDGSAVTVDSGTAEVVGTDVAATEDSTGVTLADTDATVEVGTADELGAALVVPFVITLNAAIFSAA